MSGYQYVVPDSAQLSDPSTLMEHLLAGAAYVRGTVDGGSLARVLEAAAQAIQQHVAEAKVQRGLAIASQTIASELALKCEQLQQRLDGVPAEELSPDLEQHSIPSLMIGHHGVATTSPHLSGPGPTSVAPPQPQPLATDRKSVV